MTGIELFIWILLVIGWVVFQVVRRILKPPRPLGKIEDTGEAQAPEAPWPPAPSVPVPAPRRTPAEAREAPLDVEWGRTPEAPPPPPRIPAPPRVTPPPRVPAVVVAEEPFAWSRDRAGSELALARELGRRQAERRRAAAQPARRHPHRPRLRTHADVRSAVVLATLLGPCRAFDPYRPPDQQP